MTKLTSEEERKRIEIFKKIKLESTIFALGIVCTQICALVLTVTLDGEKNIAWSDFVFSYEFNTSLLGNLVVTAVACTYLHNAVAIQIEIEKIKGNEISYKHALYKCLIDISPVQKSS